MINVVIIGGGIGGLALAQGLRRHGVQVAVYERDAHRDDRLDRYRLAINPAGSRSLRACLPDQQWQVFLDTAGRPGGGFGFLGTDLRELVVVEDAIMYPHVADPAERSYPVDRHTLRGILLDGLGDTVHYGKTFDRYEIGAAGRPTAHFADGTTATGDILVGADGINSRLRAQYLPAATCHDTHAIGVGLKLPLDRDTRTWLPARLGQGMNLVMTAAPQFLFTSAFERQQPAGDDYLLCAFVARDDQFPAHPEGLDGTRLKAHIASLTTDWHPALRQLIDQCPPEDVSAYPFRASDRPTRWTPSQVTVLGDAVHSMPPTGGNGANTALRDAALLTRQLSQVAQGQLPLLDAIGDYEADMRDYGFQAVDLAMETLRQGLTSNPVDMFFSRAWFRFCDLAAPLRRMTFGNSWAKVSAPRQWERAVTTPIRTP
ncbi:FAD-dependent oxidoreductase [Asanoa ishikariensis]|uniref:2-polyprenyl-6-methoxyphenol hydroxylase n=1 Tax=Asanoa ishikariensis TaxID=137265 RepID=A0A1H3TLR6_9ACTN|nr:NAD(P)/FAD-dependent oxidoreductase [Asanoa ishikariensis]GIF62200.1 FAD-dependent oxidoreductase [Asanoa ishikariensis]SDZ50937.1 2-polyprenyl-6-methoxyphenol hydroxylase [Asanoa ishikariensis]